MRRSASPFDYPEAKARLQAILVSPDDDDRRLVMADWLEEHGHAHRAEFIRVQVELARTVEGTDRHKQLVHRAWDIARLHRYELVADLPSWVRKSHAIFERGFLVETELSARIFLFRGTALFRRAPVQRLRLRDVTGSLPELSASALLARRG